MSQHRADLSCFELLNQLREHLFLQREKLVREVLIATKDEKGLFTWVEFSPAFHSHLIKAAFTAIGAALTSPSARMAKKCLFIFILELLNREASLRFFEVQKGKVKDAQASQEKKRLARKRSRAAKRERVRSAQQIGVVPETKKTKGTTAGCSDCGRKFASRKKFTAHACNQRADGKRATLQESVHKLLNSTKSASLPTVSPTTNSQTTPSVTATSGGSAEDPKTLFDFQDKRAALSFGISKSEGRLREYLSWVQDSGSLSVFTCEDCAKPAVGFVDHGSFVQSWYPKCPEHGRSRTLELLPFRFK